MDIDDQPVKVGVPVDDRRRGAAVLRNVMLAGVSLSGQASLR
jgi:hypothetical protein